LGSFYELSELVVTMLILPCQQTQIFRLLAILASNDK